MVRYSHASEKSGKPGKSEQRNGFGFGSVKVVGASRKNSLHGVMGTGAQLRKTRRGQGVGWGGAVGRR